MVRHSTPKLAAAALALGAAALGASVLGAGPAGASTTMVAAGDTLWGLAAEYGTTVSALAAANGITDPNRILAGQTLQLPAGPSSVTVTVSAGESLTAIAAQYGTTVSALAAANGITDPNIIDVGQQLTVSTTGSAPATSGAAGDAGSGSSSSSGSVVTVAQGDDLFSLANAYHTTVALIVAANGLADPNLIEAGVQLVIPSSGGASTASTSAGATTSGGGPSVPSPSAALAALFEEWSSAYGVPLNLLEALTWWESGWNNDEVSPTGAIGLGQLEPYTVDYIRTYLLDDQSLDPNDPSDNLQMTAIYLHYLLQATDGNEGDALAAYYQGLQSVAVNGEFSDTQNYVAGILDYAEIFGSQ